jgi:hypothetical protein
MTRGGRIVATSGEAYSERRKAEDGLVGLVTSVAGSGVRMRKDGK